MIDISMAGSTVIIKGPSINATITGFASEGDPISIPDNEVRAGEMGLNGDLVTWAKPTPITFSISLIPGTTSDKILSAALRAAHIGGKGSSAKFDAVEIDTLTIKTPHGNVKDTLKLQEPVSYVFSNGYVQSGPMAQGTNSEGKASMKTYNFTFESVNDSK